MLSRPIQYLLGAALAITAYTFWHDHSQQSEQSSEMSERPAPRRATMHASQSSAASAVAGEKPELNASNVALADLFPRQSWTPPPTPTPKPKLVTPPPTPIPVAPPLQMNITASWHEKNSNYFVLEAQGQSLILCNACDTPGRIQPGESLLGVYRLDKLTREAITFTYLPLNQQQALPTGGTP